MKSGPNTCLLDLRRLTGTITDVGDSERMRFPGEGRYARYREQGELPRSPTKVAWAAETQAHKSGRDQFRRCVESADAGLEAEVGMVEQEEAHEADNSIETPDHEGRPNMFRITGKALLRSTAGNRGRR